jgi:hypothetical protein
MRPVMKLLLLLLGGAKFGKLLTTAGTMLLSIGAYALIWGWRYAAGFVALIFCHEMGHYLRAGVASTWARPPSSPSSAHGSS